MRSDQTGSEIQNDQFAPVPLVVAAQPKRPWTVASLICLIVVGLLLALHGVLAAQPPSAAEVVVLLSNEPISTATWPLWRMRLLEWMGDKDHSTEAAYEAAGKFIAGQAVDGKTLPEPLSQDFLAWYILGREQLFAGDSQQKNSDRGKLAEPAIRKALELNPNFARTHRNLAYALLVQADSPDTPQRLAEAKTHLEAAHRFEPTLELQLFWGLLAMEKRDYAAAKSYFQQALREQPDDVSAAYGLAQSVLAPPHYPGYRSAVIKPLVESHPDDAVLICFYAASLAFDNNVPDAARELKKAQSLGTDPAVILGPELVQKIKAAAALSWWEIFGYLTVGFASVYAGIIAAMALVGWLLARYTSGLGALKLLGDNDPRAMAVDGKVARTTGESHLARCYAMSIVAGVVLFYCAIPFILVGLLVCTVGGLYVLLHMPAISINLLIILVVGGGGMVIAVLKSVFVRAGGDFGVPKTPKDCPKLYECLREVASSVDTSPVDHVFLTPGAGIGVRQTGRGPFGLFGIKRRVLTLGMAGMRYLTQNELRSVLAHEYAHFSHSDTFYSRFIYQVSFSIEAALRGMSVAGGHLNSINPFYGLLYFYYRAYSLLTAGFSRSREFLADRMAASLYGADVFASALRKVSTDATFLESTIFENAATLVAIDRSYTNMYESFHAVCNSPNYEADRAELVRRAADQEDSLFSSHPTNAQRFEALRSFPPAPPDTSELALDLFDDPAAIETQLTDFLTDHLHYLGAMGHPSP